MIFEEMMRDERKEGRLEKGREFILELLEDLGEVPEEFRDSLAKETDEAYLKAIHKAAKSESIKEFQNKAREILDLK